jgi:hypothetical protein
MPNDAADTPRRGMAAHHRKRAPTPTSAPARFTASKRCFVERAALGSRFVCILFVGFLRFTQLGLYLFDRWQTAFDQVLGYLFKMAEFRYTHWC